MFPSETYLSTDSKYYRLNEILMFNNMIVLPKSLLAVVILREHFLTLHGSRKVLKQNILIVYFVPDVKLLDKALEQLSQRCLVCSSVKAHLSRKLNYGRFSKVKSENCVQIDFIENLPFQTNLLTVINLYSHFLTVYVMKRKSTAQVINNLMSYFGSTGRIRFLTADNAAVFNNRMFDRFMDRMGITKLESVPFHSTARSIIERYNGVLQQGIMSLSFPNSDSWI